MPKRHIQLGAFHAILVEIKPAARGIYISFPSSSLRKRRDTTRGEA